MITKRELFIEHFANCLTIDLTYFFLPSTAKLRMADPSAALKAAATVADARMDDVRPDSCWRGWHLP